MARAQTAVSPFTLAIPIVKVDQEKRLVRGVATAEVLDSQGDVVDYDAAKSVFAAWKGNIREMHQPKAVGKRTDIAFDDEKREITVESYISKGAPDTWEKVCDGTLSMYSLGGRGERQPMKVGDAAANRLFMKTLSELSLVDNGACPVASFEIVKTVDGHPTEVQPDDVDIVVGIKDLDAAHKRDIPQSDRDKMPESDFAGDDQSFPIKEPKDVAAAARSLGRTKQDRDKVKANIIRIAYRKGPAFVAKLPDAWKKPDDKKEKAATAGDGGFNPEPWDIDRALSAIGSLEMLLVSEGMEAAQEPGDDTARAQVEAIRSAIALVLAFLQSEINEQFESEPDESGDEDLAEMAAAIGNVAKASTAYLAKAGARHSKADLDMIQGVHDNAVKLGATCAEKDDDGQDDAAVAMAAAASTVQKETAADQAQAAQSDAERAAMQTTITELQATNQAQADQMAQLMDRVSKLEAQPMPGGPKTRATTNTVVEKDGNTKPAATAHEVVAVLEKLAREAPNEKERERIAETLVQVQQRHGMTAVAILRPPTA